MFKHNLNQFILIFILTLMSTGCATVHYDNVSYNETSKVTTISAIDPAQKNKIDALEKAILSLGPQISPNEAHFIAREAVIYPMVLANRYDLASSPLWQNILVNHGFREDGLCWQWMHDMRSQLGSKPLKTLTFHYAVAFKGSMMKEHNALAISAKGKTVKDAIILDPWRNSGILYWNFVPKDTKYPWVLSVNK